MPGPQRVHPERPAGQRRVHRDGRVDRCAVNLRAVHLSAFQRRIPVLLFPFQHVVPTRVMPGDTVESQPETDLVVFGVPVQQAGQPVGPVQRAIIRRYRVAISDHIPIVSAGFDEGLPRPQSPRVPAAPVQHLNARGFQGFQIVQRGWPGRSLIDDNWFQSRFVKRRQAQVSIRRPVAVDDEGAHTGSVNGTRSGRRRWFPRRRRRA